MKSKEFLPRILLVDDEVEVLKLLESYFKLEGYDIQTTSDPLIALDLLENNSFHILITDMMMPTMHGNDLIRKAKSLNGLIQVIVITGHVKLSDILAAFRLGASNCFFKPFHSLDQIKEEIGIATKKINRISEVLKMNKGLGDQ